MTEILIAAAQMLKVPLESSSGLERISGHSLRTTGAQGLARLGLDLWAIQLIGRWGSERVKLYVRQAQVEAATDRATRAARDISLDQLLTEVQRKLQPEVSRNPSVAASSAPKTCEQITEHMEQVIHDIPAAAAIAKEDLVEALDREVALSGECAAKESTAPSELVVSSVGAWHKILRGPPSSSKHEWATFCGWAFGLRGGNARLEPASALPTEPKLLCQKCFGPQRQDLKRAQLVRLRRHMGEGA